MATFCILNHASTPQSLRRTFLLSDVFSEKGSESQMRVYDERLYSVVALYFPELGHTAVPTPSPAPGRLFLAASPARCSWRVPSPEEGWWKQCWSQLGNHNLWHSLPKTRAWLCKCFFSSLSLGGRRHWSLTECAFSFCFPEANQIYLFLMWSHVLNHSESRWYLLPACWSDRANKI